jgi:hypothetical protein
MVNLAFNNINSNVPSKNSRRASTLAPIIINKKSMAAFKPSWASLMTNCTNYALSSLASQDVTPAFITPKYGGYLFLYPIYGGFHERVLILHILIMVKSCF